MTEDISFKTDERKISWHVRREYDDNDRLVRANNLILDMVVLYFYSEKGQKTEEHFFTNNKLTGKRFYSDYSGDICQSNVIESYYDDGSLKNCSYTKYDTYVNVISYENYKIEMKFDEQKRVPQEKYIVNIS